MATTTSTRKRTAAKKSAARKARPVAKKARAVKKTAARKARPAAKQSRVAKRRAAKSGPKKTVKKTARKARTRVDAITLLKQDHREIARLFARFERAGDGSFRAKQRLVEEIITALSVHAGIEELVFYPALRREITRIDDDVLEAIEEHHVVKLLLHELEGTAPADERFDAKVTVMMENVRHHVKEEERALFPKVRARLGRARLFEIGDELRAAKSAVPTRPHPYWPDQPPGNVIVGNAVAVIERARTAGKQVVHRVRDERPKP